MPAHSFPVPESAGGNERPRQSDSAAPAALDLAALAHALRESFPHASDVAELASQKQPLSVAVLLPCFNEAATIADVVNDFRKSLPEARIIVFDNGSSDGTAAAAANAGAEVICEPRRGKGNVVRRMFAEVEADVYLMADGDGTYDAGAAPRLVAMIAEGRLDMAIGAREDVFARAHRRGHGFGNSLFNTLFSALFGPGFADIFSGYRAFSRRFVKSFPALSSGFEIETELSVHATALMLPVGEISLPYGKRPEGSASKLRTFRDGWRILSTFMFLLKETRPAAFFGAIAGMLAAIAILLALPLFDTYLATGLVPRLPTAILCTGLMLIACLMLSCGLILDSLARSRVEQKRMLYLAVSRHRF